ncbi:MAG TPA: D-amino-acid transaminase [Firmicutes bacterium]|nr:D-amino-acid transaminase [Bacillota bacterium]
MKDLAYLNGEYVSRSGAVISVEDRGFLFGDGVYEVVRVYSGKPFLMERHLARLERSLHEIGLDESLLPCRVRDLAEISEKLVKSNEIGEGTVYIQITRGIGKRTHAFPAQPKPTVLAMTYSLTSCHEKEREEGVRCITVPDDRWARCNVKSVNLLPNCIAKQTAAEAGCYEAIFVRDGFLMEGSSSNVFVVKDGTVVTPPLTNYILPGITRGLVIKLCADAGIPLLEASIPMREIALCSELFLTGTTTEIMPVVALDGRQIGDGRPGSKTRAIQRAYENYLRRFLTG